MSSPVAGDILAGKYRVERVLGAGGMGVVVLAMHMNLEQRVAIKLLLPDALQNVDLVQRFVQEARAAARLRGDHVVRVHDVATLEDGSPYLVMEYLEGQDLDEVLHARGKLSSREAVDYVLQACEAIAEAHGAGIVHRDLKPSNLFLATTADGGFSIKILDFGISKIAPKDGAISLSVTKTRALMGSPLYMAPEQMRSTRSSTPKVDVWALGVILYELVVGAPPFMAETMPEICAMVLSDPLPPLLAVCPDAPDGLDDVIAMATQKDPALRCDVATLARALLPFASETGWAAATRVFRTSRASLVTLSGEDSLPPPSVRTGSGPPASGRPSSPGRSPADAAAQVALAYAPSKSLPPDSRPSMPEPPSIRYAPQGTSWSTRPTAAEPDKASTFGGTSDAVRTRSRSGLLAGTAIVATACCVCAAFYFLGARRATSASVGSAGRGTTTALASSLAPPLPSPSTATDRPHEAEVDRTAAAASADVVTGRAPPRFDSPATTGAPSARSAGVPAVAVTTKSVPAHPPPASSAGTAPAPSAGASAAPKPSAAPYDPFASRFSQ